MSNSTTASKRRVGTRTLTTLSVAERRQGWVEYHCPDHGGLVAGPATFTVACKCRKKAVPTRDGKPVDRGYLTRLRRQAQNAD